MFVVLVELLIQFVLGWKLLPKLKIKVKKKKKPKNNQPNNSTSPPFLGGFVCFVFYIVSCNL